MRDTNPVRRRNRLLTVLLLPVFVVAWFVGWSLYWAGSRKDSEKPRKRVKSVNEHVTLIPASAIELENEELELVRRQSE